MVKVNNTDNLHGKDAISSVKHERADKTNAPRNVPAKDVKVTLGKDTVELSDKSAEFSKLVDQVKQLPDIRQDRVNEIKQKLASGSYKPSAEDIADAMLKDE